MIKVSRSTVNRMIKFFNTFSEENRGYGHAKICLSYLEYIKKNKKELTKRKHWTPIMMLVCLTYYLNKSIIRGNRVKNTIKALIKWNDFAHEIGQDFYVSLVPIPLGMFAEYNPCEEKYVNYSQYLNSLKLTKGELWNQEFVGRNTGPRVNRGDLVLFLSTKKFSKKYRDGLEAF